MRKSDTVYNYLLSYIDSQRWGDSNRLPSETAIAARLRVSRETVRSAMSRMKAENLIYTVKGSGSFFYQIRKQSRPGSQNVSKVGIFLHGVDTTANLEILHGISSALNPDIIRYDVFQTNNSYEEELKCIRSCLNGYSAFVIDAIKSALPNPNIWYYKRMREKGIGVVFYNNFYPGLMDTAITVNEYKATQFIMDQLLMTGHSQIGGIFCIDQYQAMEKYRCFVEYHSQHGLQLNENRVLFCFTEDMQKPSVMRKRIGRLVRNQNLDALICCNELIYSPAAEAVGSLIDVACYDSAAVTAKDKRICSIHPGETMGMKIGEILNSMVQGKTFLNDYSYVFDPVFHTCLQASGEETSGI